MLKGIIISGMSYQNGILVCVNKMDHVMLK